MENDFKSYFLKQRGVIEKLFLELSSITLSKYENRYVFLLKTQHFYTAIEDLLKHLIKTFQGRFESLSSKEILVAIFDINLLSKESYLLLVELRAFRQVIWDVYDREFDEKELSELKNLINCSYHFFKNDCDLFLVKNG